MGIPFQYIDGHPPFFQDGWSLEDFYGVFEEYQKIHVAAKPLSIRRPTSAELEFCNMMYD